MPQEAPSESTSEIEDEDTSSTEPELLQKEYDEQLSQEQQELKQSIMEQHNQATAADTQKFYHLLMESLDDIDCVVMTDANFNCILVLANPSNLVSLLESMDMKFDFTYAFAIMEDGYQRSFGLDSYTDDVNEVFEEISDYLLNTSDYSKETLLEIENINIFQQIYTDF